MSDPFNTQWGEPRPLWAGETIRRIVSSGERRELGRAAGDVQAPYTDEYDRTMPSPTYFLPQLSPSDLAPASPDSNPPQDQSAALLGPSAFAPPADVGILGPVTPPGAVTVATRDGWFYAPTSADFQSEYRAGQDIGAEPTRQQFKDIGKAVGQGGKFDYQRAGGHFNPDYRDASNFGVGVLMQGAGYSWPETAAISSAYATLKGRPDVIQHDWPLWSEGYDAAAAGQLPKKGTP